jgi:plasmid stability protein
MTRLTVELGDELVAKLSARAATSGHDVESYVRAVLAEHIEFEDIDYGAPAALSPRTPEEFDALMLEGLKSPSHEMTDQRWAELHRRVRERHERAR